MRDDPEFKATHVFLSALLLPLIAGLVLLYIGPYLYPVTETPQGVSVRFIPILGGKGYH